MPSSIFARILGQQQPRVLLAAAASVVAASAGAVYLLGGISLEGLRSYIWTTPQRELDAIFVATPPSVVRAMLDLVFQSPRRGRS